MKKVLIVTFLFVIVSAAKQSNAQNTFSKVYYDSLQQGIFVSAVVSTFDNHFVFAGQTQNEYGYILKVDSAGNPIWSKKGENIFNCIAATNDSCFILGGNNEYSKINSNGNILWAKTISSSNTVQVFSIQQSLDSGYAMTGFDNGHNQIYIVKTDANGNLQWSKSLSMGNISNQSISIKQASDSSYYIAGYFENSPPYSSNVFLMKLSASGNILWAKQYGSGNTSFNDFEITTTGIVLYINEFNSALVKTDFSGNIIWSKLYTISSGNGYFMFGGIAYSKIHKTSDTSIVFVRGDCGSVGDISKTDSAGNLKWTKNIMLPAVEAVETKDKGYFIVGNGPICGMKMESTTSAQIGVVKVDSLGNSSAWQSCLSNNWATSSPFTLNVSAAAYALADSVNINSASFGITNIGIVVDSGCVAVLSTVKENNFEKNISISPNPFSVQTTLQTIVPLHNATLAVYNCFGQTVAQINYLNGQTIIFDRDNLQSGLYFIRLTQDDKVIATSKLVIMD